MRGTVVELYVIGRLDDGDRAADLFGWEVECVGVGGRDPGRVARVFWESVIPDPMAPAELDSLDAALIGAGYQRTSAWRMRMTSAGAVRYFTEAAVTDRARQA